MSRVAIPKLRPWQYQTLRWAAISAIIALTALPAARLTTILTTTGANNLSSDDGIFNNKFLDKVLNGTYDWQSFPRDTFFNTHSLFFPALVYIGLAYFTDFNVYAAIYLGLVLAAFKLILLHGAFTQNGTPKRWERWLLWPVLAALVFSVSQISAFEHGLTAVAGGLSWLAFAIGVWALARFRRKWRGLLLMAAAGFVATLSSGTGLIMWPSFLLGMLLLSYRRVWHYLLWIGAAAVSALPYVFFLYLDPQRAAHSQSTLLSPFNYQFILATLGRPLANGINADYSTEMPIPLHIGFAGIAMLSVGLVLLLLKHRQALTRSAPALMLIFFSLLTLWQVSLFRGGIPPYYTPISMVFWIGLLGLSYCLWNSATTESDQSRRDRIKNVLARLWSAGTVLTVVLLYGSSSFTYADKTDFLRTRAPASAACLRNYKNAPTYCEETLVVWPLGKTGYLRMLAEPLEHHHLSVFAPHQEWTLQGDFILDSVRIDEKPGIPDIVWSADLTATPVSWRDYRHLNLFLHTPNSISWTVSLPPNLQRADFHSAIAISQSVPVDPSEDGVEFEVHIEPEGGQDELAFTQHAAPDQHVWRPFAIPLTAYAGQTITIRLTSSPGGNITGDWAMYCYPYIDLQLDTTRDAGNTVYKSFAPTPTEADTRFDIANSSLWQTSNLQELPAESGTRAWTLNSNPAMRFNPALDLRLADYSHFYIRVAASPDNYPMTLQIQFSLSDDPLLLRSITMPLYADGAMHEYTYDLKLLELDQRVRLVGIGLHPTREGPFTGQSWMKISDFRLIRRGSSIDR
jgi:hypothetical protein